MYVAKLTIYYTRLCPVAAVYMEIATILLDILMDWRIGDFDI
jgi:hypothetical protein